MKQAPQTSSGHSVSAQMLAEIDWRSTPLGERDKWPQSLKTSLSICLDCRFPVVLWWGAEKVLLYNDDFIPILGEKHPAAMGRNGADVCAEVWPVLGPSLASVVKTGKAVKATDFQLLLNRHGYREETYFSFSFSPIRDESGGVGGVFAPVIETTEKVIGHRRTEILRMLGSQPRASNLPAACRSMAGCLAGKLTDVPFGLIYTLDDALGRADLAASFGTGSCPDVAPDRLLVSDPASAWPLAEAIAAGGIHLVSGLGERFRRVPAGAWGAPVRQAVIAPLSTSGGERPVAVLVAGVSPHHALDAAYLSFYKLLANQLQGSICEALAYGAEHRRVEALAQLDRAKTVFFSNVSHELRTPLTLMLGPIEELLENHELPEASREQVQFLQRNGLRLLKLVNALLDFSRIEAGRMRAVFEPVDLTAYTADLASVFRSAVEKAGLRLDVRCRPLREPVYIDRGMWEKVVLNLLSNAFKFTFEGTISISVSEYGGRAVLTVADTGVGIPPDQLARVFERFHRIEGMRARTHEGTGIGLALVRDLVALHGGDIRIDSAPGRGTLLEISLPFGKAHLPPDQVVDAAPRNPRPAQAEAFIAETELWLAGDAPAQLALLDADADPPATPAAPRTLGDIFVVDDNADMRHYVARLLRPRWNVHTFADGAQALQAARVRPPGLIIADVMMPVTDGFALLAALRKDPVLQDVPVILLSGRAGEEARVSGMQAGADDYLVKPFSSRELVARAEALHLRSQLRAVEKAQARRMEAALAHVPAAIAILRGPEHVFELANRSYLELVGSRPVIGKPVREALPELEGQGIYELLDQVYRTGQPHVGHAKRLEVAQGGGKARQEFFFDFVYQPMLEDDGTVERIAVVVFDVSDLSRARQAAEQASRTKDEFLAMLGHELRNPLSPIMTALELMKLRGIEGAEKERAIIERQANHLLRLVDDLLDVARVARGKIKLRRRHVELAEVLARAIETASPLLEEKRHTLRIDVPSRGMPVHVDPDRFAQVLANLLTNAAKYTDRCGTIIVRGQYDGGKVVVEVEDNGSGISAEMLPRIFDMFEQGRQGLARSPGGLGLGLSIVRSLTELHGGSVSARSAGPGRGSTFVVGIPASGLFAEDEHEASSMEQQEGAPPDRLSILVVDDNADAARALVSLISTFGHRTLLAFDGPSALECLNRHTPQLAILDIGLPDLDGYALARRIRAMHGKDSVFLAALTGYGQDSDRRKAMDAGFDQHIVKPMSLARLQELLRVAQARKNLRRH